MKIWYLARHHDQAAPGALGCVYSVYLALSRMVQLGYLVPAVFFLRLITAVYTYYKPKQKNLQRNPIFLVEYGTVIYCLSMLHSYTSYHQNYKLSPWLYQLNEEKALFLIVNNIRFLSLL